MCRGAQATCSCRSPMMSGVSSRGVRWLGPPWTTRWPMASMEGRLLSESAASASSTALSYWTSSSSRSTKESALAVDEPDAALALAYPLDGAAGQQLLRRSLARPAHLVEMELQRRRAAVDAQYGLRLTHRSIASRPPAMPALRHASSLPSENIRRVVVHHPRGLHMSVHDGRSHEAEPPPLQVLAQALGLDRSWLGSLPAYAICSEWSRRSRIAKRMRRSSRTPPAPRERRCALVTADSTLSRLRTMPGVGKQAVDVGWAEARHLARGRSRRTPCGSPRAS